MNIKNLTYKLCLLLLLPLFAASYVRGEDYPIKIGEVVVTATRTEETVENIPANVTVITQEDIKKSAASTVQELLRDEEGLIIKDLYGTGTKSTVDMRGFGRGLNTVILIDGRRANEIDLSGVDWNLIPLENIERIEIVRGSGSVLYGDNAMAGVINLITKKGMTLKPLVEFDTMLESYDGNKEHFSIRGAKERISYFFFLKHRETDGYRYNSEFDADDVNANLSVNITDNLYVDIWGGYHKDHQGLPGGLTESELMADRRQTTEPDNGVDYEQYFYGARIVHALAWGEVTADLNFNSRKAEDILAGDISGTPYLSATERDTDKKEAKLKLTVRPDIFNHKNVLVAGMDYYRSDVSNTNKFEYFGVYTTRADLEKTETGFYLNDEFFLDDIWSLTAGYRYTGAKFKDSVVTDFSSGKGGQKFNESAIKAGIAYNYAPGAKIFAGFSRGFRFPTTDELFAFDGTVARLKPEQADTYEAGVVHPFNENIVTRLTVYRMDVNDELFLNPAVGLFGENENIDKTEHQGAEFGFSAELNSLVSLFGNATYSEAKFESGPYSGKTIPLVPRYSANLGADIVLPGGAALALRCNWAGERFLENDVDNTKEKLSSYLTADAKLSYHYKIVTMYIGVNNIFNEKYSEFGAFGWSSGNIKFYPAPERQFYGGVKIVF